MKTDNCKAKFKAKLFNQKKYPIDSSKMKIDSEWMLKN